MFTDDNNAPTSNPFASPESTAPTGKWKTGEFMISENRIIGGKEIWLPFLCVKCGDKVNESDETAVRKSKNLSWVHPAVTILVFLNMLVFLLVALIVRKKCSVTYSLCRDCRAKRRNLWLTLCLLLVAIVGTIAGMIMLGIDATYPLLVGVVGFVMVLVFAFLLNGPLTIYWYSSDTFKLRGAGKTFLERADIVEADEPAFAAVLAEDGRTI